MSLEVVYLFGLCLIVALAVISIYFSYTRSRKENLSSLQWGKNWLADFSTEMAGAFITTLIFGLFVTIIQNTSENNLDKSRLISQLGSSNNDIALTAGEDLLGRGWLRDGTLQDISLIGANLQGGFFKQANLQGAYLNWANLRGAHLMYANLERANLFSADFCGALLAYTNFHDADLTNAILRDATLDYTDFRGANLYQADLRGTSLQRVLLDENTILPDGSSFHPDRSDFDLFTNPNNPNFLPMFDSLNPDASVIETDCVELRPPDLPR